jgi:beta-phosphoglucomutase-like phosphatase (HAD superfamily)
MDQEQFFEAAIFGLGALVNMTDPESSRDDRKVALFQSLRQRDVKIAVCSTLDSERTNRIIDRIGLRSLVDTIVCQDDVESDLYITASRCLSVDMEKCVIIEWIGIGEGAVRVARPGLIVMVDGPEDVTEFLL